ncbi:MAG: hypothetical protein ACRDRR_04945 [Pseudonocardiaceae bacterium]
MDKQYEVYGNARPPAGDKPASTLAAAIERFHAAYVNGIPELRRRQPTHRPTFDDQLQALVAARCTRAELLHYSRFKHQRREGLKAARQGSFSAARLDLNLARGYLREIDTAEVRLVGASSYLAALAYLQYRQLKPAQARRLVERALAIDVRLENEFALGIMYGHRIQLVHNLVRVEARFGTVRGAIDLGVVLLEQLEGRIDASPTSHPWDQDDHRKVDPTQRRLLFNLIISDIALLQLQAGPQVAEEASDIYQRHLANCSHEQRQLFADGHAWLTLRANLKSCKIPESLNLASEYLERDARGAPILWYETAMSAALQLCNSDNAEVRSLGGNILEEGTRLPFTPNEIRARGFPPLNNPGAAASDSTSGAV